MFQYALLLSIPFPSLFNFNVFFFLAVFSSQVPPRKNVSIIYSVLTGTD